MKNFTNTCLYLSICIILISCNKEIPKPNTQMQEADAIADLKKIVGEKGTISILSTSNVGQEKFQGQTVDPKTKMVYLTIEEFKIVHAEYKNLYLKSNGYLSKVVSGSTENSIKSNSFKSFDNYDTLNPGFYNYRIFPNWPIFPYQGNSSYLTFMNVYFQISPDKSVIGAPQISFTGINLFNWNQIASSTINFNPLTNTSTFTVVGSATFGIQMGGITLGWSSSNTFGISINPDDLKPVIVNEQN